MATTKYQPGLRVSEYLLEQLLGCGTFGEVWQARHHVWESDRVAIKLPTEPEYVRFLQREGLVVHGLKHANIVRVLGLDPYADVPYMIMELVRGPSLKQVIEEHPKGCDLPVAVTILRGILAGIAAAHAAGVVHRDLKPGNVLLDLNGKPLDRAEIGDVKIGDFGLGVPNEDAFRSMVMQSVSVERDRRSQTLAGTLAYMAPELRETDAKPSPKTDLFSVGVVLFELLTGERPAGAELPSSLRNDVPALLNDVFTRLYAREERRFATADAVSAELEKRWPTAPLPPLPPGQRRFRYRAVDAAGQKMEGEIAGRDSDDALEKLRRLGLVVQQVVEDAYNAPAAAPASDDRTTCSNCHASIASEDQFCTQCGEQLVESVRRCPKCGGWPGPFDRYCIHCGTAVATARG